MDPSHARSLAPTAEPKASTLAVVACGMQQNYGHQLAPQLVVVQPQPVPQPVPLPVPQPVSYQPVPMQQAPLQHHTVNHYYKHDNEANKGQKQAGR
eukprot:164715_1